MIDVNVVEECELKYEISKKIMSELSDWFISESIEEKARYHKNLLFWSALNEDSVKGFIAVKIHNEYTLEIYNFGVLQKNQREGIGHKLLENVILYAEKNNYKFLTVKTLDASADYEPYDRSRRFYQKEGFLPLEVMIDYWDEDNPCLYLIKVLN